MHILDTDTLTYLHAGHSRVRQRLQELDDPEVAITVITRIEVLRGRFDFILKAATGADLLKAQRFLTRSEDLLEQIVTLPLNEQSAAEFDRLKVSGRLSKIGRADLLIASIALSYRAILVTRNIRHFSQVPGLTIVNWID
ncbi:MAG: PIN domain-containing protein [Anaerolineae bacterium]|nr:PIN domain-containing protein [Anaerolineae bacterium]MCB0207430.1 PIN domain-containing protein [Anaerolineae bacterium]MCB0253378.1 PIN domain-containing protein [Anaerolineae bacterium]